ncbi:MAG: hydrogenase formation protein HypD [Gemmataceae bacterium]|nr:hydrogenase formation protein HypD [Gemmataceae bacterium]
MKFVDEYRDAEGARALAEGIRRAVTRPWTIMEVCGGQTHAIMKFGIDQMLPGEIRVIHGPGCPVCVTPQEYIDSAIDLACRRKVMLCSFGDMLRVPGSAGSLLQAPSRGADVRTVYSPLDAVEIAALNPAREVVFFAVGFETTAPVTALAVTQARARGLNNFSLLVAHVTVPGALRALLGMPGNTVQGILAAGHVCTVMGWHEYVSLADGFRVPIVVTGFEPVDLLEGILRTVRQLEAGRHVVENQYSRAVREFGNESARRLIDSVYRVADCSWRGLGIIPQGGLRLRPEWCDYDAEVRFGRCENGLEPESECRAGDVLRGLIRPDQCPAFGTRCHPENPLGAPMVSSEGACAAYWKYGRRSDLGSPAS